MYRTGLVLLSVVVVLCSISAGDAAVDFGYSNKCFFTTGQSENGTWWFIDPSGKPFISLGVSAVTYAGYTSNNGTRDYYDAARAKFGNQSNWADSVVERLVAWNFNTIAAFSDSVVVTKGMPYVVNLGMGKGFNNKWVGGKFPDPFDPQWEANIRVTAQSSCFPRRNDPLLLGYFIDNELWWGPMGGVRDRYDGTFLDQMLVNLNDTAPGYQRALAFIKAKYSTIDELNAAWGSDYTSFETINYITNTSTTLHTNDSSTFAYTVAAQFFNVSTRVIREYDPYHLILGVRYAGNSPVRQILQANGEFCDVVSFNLYPLSGERAGPPATRLNNWHTQANGKPVLISEFSYRGKDVGLPNTKGAGLIVNTQAERGEGYKNYTTSIIKSPGVIGFHWYEWADEPVSGRVGDNEDSNYGLVNLTDHEYWEVINRMKEANLMLYDLHGESLSNVFTGQCFAELKCLNDCSGHGCCNTDTGLCSCDNGFSGSDCSTDYSQLEIKSFSSLVGSSTWRYLTGSSSPQFYMANMTTADATSGELQLAIAQCPGSCSGQAYASGGLKSVTKFSYGYYSALIQAPANDGFKAQFDLTNSAGKRDAYTMRMNRTTLDLDYSVLGAKQVLGSYPLPFANASAGFHNYSIHYLPDSFAFLVDGELLVSFNASTAPLGLLNSTLAVSFFIAGSAASSRAESDVMLVSAVSFAQADNTKATCDGDNGGGGDDGNHSAAAGLVPMAFRALVALFA